MTRNSRLSSRCSSVRFPKAHEAEYQLEIDQITARARTAESAFLEIVQKLSLAPDPVPLIENVLVRSALVLFFLLVEQIQIDKLKEYQSLKTEHEELKKQFSAIDVNKMSEMEATNLALKQRLIKYEVMVVFFGNFDHADG